MLKEILYYQTIDSKLPIFEWLFSLDSQTRARLLARIARLARGNLGDCKNVGNSVLELRFHFGPGYRIYLVQCGEVLVLLLCGGDKSTQEKDIRLAKFYWEDYKRRTQDETLSKASRSSY